MGSAVDESNSDQEGVFINTFIIIFRFEHEMGRDKFVLYSLQK